MEYQHILYEKDGNVLTVTLNRPEKLNAQTRRMHAELMDAADQWDADDSIRAVIITGAGRGFCAGTDLGASNSWGKAVGSDAQEEFAPQYVNGIRRDGGGKLVLRLFDSKKPMIAAVNGPAVGIGATFILPMDVRIASDQARFGYVFTQRAIVPESCSSWFLPRIVGIGPAIDWVISGRVFPAAEALQHKLVSEVLPPDQLLPRARAIAKEYSERTAPVSVAVSRQLLWRMLGPYSAFDANEMESQALTALRTQADAGEGAKSFLEKRPPKFTMRPSVDMPKSHPWWPQREFKGKVEW
jgi:enoyl-CoA hydratase/carnithine racemase